ncbi:MAG: SDR family oxidoreductase [Neptuniibacter sp.]
MNLNNQRCMLIGASGGIGAAASQLLAQQGAELMLCGRNAEMLQQQVDELPSGGPSHRLLVADICSEEGRWLITDAIRKHQISTVINLAGINELIAFEKQDPVMIEQIITTNVTAVLLLSRQVITLFQEKQVGTLVNVGSALGFIGMPGYATYCSSKFAIRGFCEALARELADGPIKVKYFSPRTTNTRINSDQATAMNRELGNKTDSPEHVAEELIKFLDQQVDCYQVGWPEKLFVRINGVFPGIVSNAIRKQLPIINKYIK